LLTLSFLYLLHIFSHDMSFSLSLQVYYLLLAISFSSYRGAAYHFLIDTPYRRVISFSSYYHSWWLSLTLYISSYFHVFFDNILPFYSSSLSYFSFIFFISYISFFFSSFLFFYFFIFFHMIGAHFRLISFFHMTADHDCRSLSPWISLFSFHNIDYYHFVISFNIIFIYIFIHIRLLLSISLFIFFIFLHFILSLFIFFLHYCTSKVIIFIFILSSLDFTFLHASLSHSYITALYLLLIRYDFLHYYYIFLSRHFFVRM